MAICNNCGTPLRDDEIFCGSCGAKNDHSGINLDPQGFRGGQPYGAGYYYPQMLPVSGMAVASLVLGILAWVVGWFTLGIPAILGIILGLLGLSECKRGDRSGRGLAIAGLVLSLAMAALLIGIYIFNFAFVRDAFEIVYEMPSMDYYF